MSSDICKFLFGQSPTILLRLDRAQCWISPLAIGLAAALLPPDANFDLANYHLYNAWAFLNGNFDYNFFPSNMQAFFNPLIDVPFYLANGALSGRLVAFLLGAFQGICFPLLYAIARAMLLPGSRVIDILGSAIIALSGLTAAVSIAELGTTFYDYVSSVGFLACLALLTASLNRLSSHGSSRALWLVLAAGVALGSVVGLKQTNVFLAFGTGIAVPLLCTDWRSSLKASAMFALGGLLSVAVFDGPWMMFLWQHFQNPVFPFFNAEFHSPFASNSDFRDVRFLPHGWMETLFYPFIFAIDPLRVAEVAERDLRLPTLYATIPIGILCLIATQNQERPMVQASRRRYLLFLLVASGLATESWILLFSIRRYALPLEMLAPLIVSMVVAELPWPSARMPVGVGLISLLIVTTVPVTWGRSDWRTSQGHMVTVEAPPLVHTGDMVLLAGWRPKSFVIPYFPPGVRFVRIDGDEMTNAVLVRFSAELAKRISTHLGRFFVLIHSSAVKGASNPPALAVLSKYDLVGVVDGCKTLHTNLETALKGPLLICPLHRGVRNVGFHIGQNVENSATVLSRR